MRRYKQRGWTDCGVACLQMLANGVKNKKLPYTYIEKTDKDIFRQGKWTDWNDMKILLKKLKIVPKNKRLYRRPLRSWYRFKQFFATDKKVVVLASVNKNKKGDWHWVVLEKNKTWRVYDPLKSTKKVNNLSEREKRTKLYEYMEIIKK